MEKLKIVFMGTPDFAVTILNGILENQFEVCGVITAPDKPAGRGRQLNESAVKQFAAAKQLKIMQPTNLKDEVFQEELKSLGANLFVVVAFRMLPESVWSMPKLGTINLHASLLPQYRGAAPINWAIINGEKETGVTTFFIEKEIDTGKIIHQSKVEIPANMTAGELHDALAERGVIAVNETLDMIVKNDLRLIDQKDVLPEDLKSAPKIHKEDSLIDFNQTAQTTVNLIRGMSPYPGAWFELEKDGKIFKTKIFNVTVTKKESSAEKTIELDENSFLFPCADYFIAATDIQIEGKRRMSFTDFTAGNDITEYKIHTKSI